jgi:hypothetical protein
MTTIPSPIRKNLVESDVSGIVGAAETVGVHVPDRQSPPFVLMNEGKGRRRDRGGRAESGDKRPGKGRFPGSEIAAQAENIPRAEQRCHADSKVRGLLLGSYYYQ